MSSNARPHRRVVGDGHGEDVDRDVAERYSTSFRRHERVVDVLGALGGPRRRRRDGGDAARFRFFRATIDEESDLISRHELSKIPYDLRRGSAQKHGQLRGESSFSSFPGFAV